MSKVKTIPLKINEPFSGVCSIAGIVHFFNNPFKLLPTFIVELKGVEPSTFRMRTERSPIELQPQKDIEDYVLSLSRTIGKTFYKSQKAF